MGKWYAEKGRRMTNAERQAKYKRENPEKVKALNDARVYEVNYERQQEIWRADPKFYLWKNARDRCRTNGREFSITVDDFTLNEFCPYLGIKLYCTISGHVKPDSMTLDRINNAKGYIPGNVEIISHRANRLKGDGSLEEHLKIAERMERLLKND